MTTLPEHKVNDDFWIYRHAYAKSLSEFLLIQLFLFMNRFSKFLLHILGHKGILNNYNEI